MAEIGSGLYQELKKELDRARKEKYNLIVVSVPGMGGSHLLKKYVTENPGVKYIPQPGMELGNFSVLDFGMDLNGQALEWVDEYFRKAGVEQKMVVLVNTPYLLKSEDYQNSYCRGHIYKSYWLRALRREEFPEKWQESGGLPQLIKYLIAGGDESSRAGIVEPILRVLGRCDQEDLKRMGLVDKEGVISQILRSYRIESEIDIKIDFDLGFWEAGNRGEEKLVAVEADILKKMLANRGKITKEEVSDIKWGEGKYESFSDQAINKAMRRLSEKMRRYEIVTIPRVGYKIEKRK